MLYVYLLYVASHTRLCVYVYRQSQQNPSRGFEYAFRCNASTLPVCHCLSEGYAFRGCGLVGWVGSGGL